MPHMSPFTCGLEERVSIPPQECDLSGGCSVLQKGKGIFGSRLADRMSRRFLVKVSPGFPSPKGSQAPEETWKVRRGPEWEQRGNKAKGKLMLTG